MTGKFEKFVQYGVTTDLAAKATESGLSVSSVRTIRKADLVSRYGLSEDEASVLKQAVVRDPIDEQISEILLSRSNYLCALCKGKKGTSYVIHHIIPYEKTQDNSYGNLIVLCPNDHDMAHQSGLSMRITEKQLHAAKQRWEAAIELYNAQKAARALDIHQSSIHFANIRRIEELCLNLFGSIPELGSTRRLMADGILSASGIFEEKYVREKLSHGDFLFDYHNAGEGHYYHDLMRKISGRVEFVDLSDAIDRGVRATQAAQGHYAYFIGGVSGQGPRFPVTRSSPPMLMHYRKRKVRVEWQIDPNFVMSRTSFGMLSGSVHLIVYCFVQSVLRDEQTKDWIVRAQPLLIGHPLVSVSKKPAIAYTREWEAENEDAASIDDV